jgi:predicted O-methyltransferase YrrM
MLRAMSPQASATPDTDPIENQSLWTAVDRYIDARLIPSDPILDATLQANADAELPAIGVAPNQGKLLQILAQMCGARRILEIGTLGAYSTIWLARALPADGKLITLEANPKHAEIARANLQRAGLASLVELRLAPAVDSLAQLHAEAVEPFDFIFIDADKENYPAYLEGILKLSRPGTVLVADNVIRSGGLLDPGHPDPRVHGVRQLFDQMANHPRLTATALQTVGSKGHDGFAIAVVK